jgi:hypothetical protein
MDLNIKNIVKKSLLRLFPRVATQFFSARSRAFSQRLAREWGCVALNHKIIQQCGNKVLHGPFSGMILTGETWREHLSPFLLGTYERELSNTWNSIFKYKFTQILDIGAKFGFYAVGLAQHFPQIPVIAFDTDPWARKATREMSAANGVHVQVMGFCDPSWMRSHLQRNALIFSDCEGYEAHLFGSSIPNTSSATMLIELHEQFSPGVTQAIQEKYSASHKISIIPSEIGRVEMLPELAFLGKDEQKMAVTEHRTVTQAWMLLEPIASSLSN